MNLIRILGVYMVLGLVAACAGTTANVQPSKAIVHTIQEEDFSSENAAKRDPTSNAGLWKEISSRALFQDLRAYRVGDLVTINIVETSKASKKADTKTARQSSIDMGITNALGWESKLQNLGAGSGFDNTAMFKASAKNSHDGSGSTTRDESMTAYLTARVVKVMPNGNLFIKGTRQVKVNHETQFITLSGVIRHEDISPDNTILSSYIADAKIDYTGSGPISDKQRAGWLTRALDTVWPF